jgi:hypothetical protein
MAAHESPRTTKLYDRRGDEMTLDEVERIGIAALSAQLKCWRGWRLRSNYFTVSRASSTDGCA